jgi:large subunit ribosomal protein L27e
MPKTASAPQIMKEGRVVILLQGRFAGKKAVVVETCEGGNDSKKFAHAVVVGIENTARKITKSMSEAKKEKKVRMKAFVKAVNYTHLLPTRYIVDVSGLGLKGLSLQSVSAGEQGKKGNLKNIAKGFSERYLNQVAPDGAMTKKQQSVQFFFEKLRF